MLKEERLNEFQLQEYKDKEIEERNIPFQLDISVLIKIGFKKGKNCFFVDGRKIELVCFESGFIGWIKDCEKGWFPIILSDNSGIDVYPGWNLIILKNKEIEMFIKNRFFLDNRGRLMGAEVIKENKLLFDTTNNSLYKSVWVKFQEKDNLLPYNIRKNLLDEQKLFIFESLKKVIIIFGEREKGYCRYTFQKKSFDHKLWFYSFAGYDDLGYKIDFKKKCLTDISPECYLRNSNKFLCFEDPLVTFIIKMQLKISGRGIVSSDLVVLQELDLEGYKIFSLTGLEKCIGLKVLKIRGHYFAGLPEIISSLPSLKKIFLTKELYTEEELKNLVYFL